MAEADRRIKLRPATVSDRGLISSWLRQPEVIAWWGPPSATEAEVALALGSASALCRIIEVDGVPIGYGHAVDAALWGDAAANLPPGTWDLDIFIAAAAHRGKGHGSAALGLLVGEVFSTTLAVAVSVFTSIRNETAVRAYEKAGFSWKRIHPDPAGELEWVMLIERPGQAGR